MKLPHFVFLLVLVLMFVAPKLILWVAVLALLGVLVVSGPVLIASLFVPRPPKN